MRPTSLYGDIITFALFWSSSMSSKWLNQSSLLSLTYWCGVTLKDFIVTWPFYWYCPRRVLQERGCMGLLWCRVHPYQVRVSTIDDVARELTLLASARPNWPYTFVWFNRDTCQMPLPKEDHLGAMAEGTPSNIPCGRICQLEVHQLLHSEAPHSVPRGTEWVFSSGNNHSARITVPWHNYAWWWAYLPTSGHLTIHSGWT